MNWIRPLMLGLLMLGTVLGTAACAGRRSSPSPSAGAPSPPVAESSGDALGIEPARVSVVNGEHRFVVIDFAARVMPALGASFPVYRNGQLVGRVRITEPVRARFATADILEGKLKAGDLVGE